MRPAFLRNIPTPPPCSFYRSQTGYRLITQRLKYHSDYAAGRYFASMLGREMAASPIYSDVDAVIPVPLHWTRLWPRGHNQAEIIAEVLASFLGAEMRTDILYRSRRTRTQTKLSVEGKARNVTGAFQVRRKRASLNIHTSFLWMMFSRPGRRFVPARRRCGRFFRLLSVSVSPL